VPFGKEESTQWLSKGTILSAMFMVMLTLPRGQMLIMGRDEVYPKASEQAYPDTMPQAIKLIDAEGRSCIYAPITQNGKVVDSQRYVLDLEDE
jgi:hypothetical protein